MNKIKNEIMLITYADSLGENLKQGFYREILLLKNGILTENK
jgi:hypothetical protein